MDRLSCKDNHIRSDSFVTVKLHVGDEKVSFAAKPLTRPLLNPPEPGHMGCRTSPELRHVAYTRVRLFGVVIKLTSLPKVECELNNVSLMSRKNVGRIERPHSYL